MTRQNHLKNVTYKFTHWGMEKTGNGIEFTRPWRGFQKYIETKSFFLLYIADADAHFIQKRMFKNSEEIDEFRNFLDENIVQH